jgi:hypothetical protein
MLLRPAWIDNLPNELQECSVGDIMMMILDKVAVALISLLENSVNGAFVDPINAALKPIKNVKILGSKPFDFIKLMKRLCIPYKDIKDCRSEAELAELAALLGCSWDDRSLWKRCYYERVRHPRVRARCATHPPRGHRPRAARAGQVDLPRGRRDGQRLQGPLPAGLAGRAAGGVRGHRGRLLRRRRPVAAAALRRRQPGGQRGRAEHLRRPDARLAGDRQGHPGANSLPKRNTVAHRNPTQTKCPHLPLCVHRRASSTSSRSSAPRRTPTTT